MPASFDIAAVVERIIAAAVEASAITINPGSLGKPLRGGLK
jgi:hypothetical protein